MTKKVSYLEEGSNTFKYAEVNAFSKVCPYCDLGVDVVSREGYLIEDTLQILFICPRNECRQAFIGVYKKILVKDPIKPVDYVLVRTEPQIKYIKKDIDTRIMSISPVFATIFSEAGEAEALNLENIAGMGYRKSLEFLIKDYLISKNIEDRENIERKSLGQCINQDIDNPNIKSMAARAAWLGNDETHYSRKHASMSIIDLKLLIEATQYWILMELIKDEYQSKLPNAR